MNKILEQIFKNRRPNAKRLLAYGFERFGDVYLFKTTILDGQFALTVKVEISQVYTELIDTATDEQYTLFLADGAVGSFVGSVRSAYEAVLLEVAERCFDKYVFKTDYAQQIIRYVTEKYGDELEFLWDKFTDNAIWRRVDNRKWYALLVTATKDKLGLPSKESAEMLDVRGDAEKLVDGVRIFKGYHMNKKSWITVVLDGSVPLDDIYKLIDDSYQLAAKK